MSHNILLSGYYRPLGSNEFYLFDDKPAIAMPDGVSYQVVFEFDLTDVDFLMVHVDTIRPIPGEYHEEKMRYVLTDGFEVITVEWMTETELSIKDRQARSASGGNWGWVQDDNAHITWIIDERM